jgi:hypothetical protein
VPMRVYAPHAEVQAAMNESKGTPIDRVLTGIFCFAAVEPAILFASVELLAAGPGLGVQCVDGRVRNPGLDAKRPRGFRPDDAIPLAAKVGAPTLLSASMVYLTLVGESTLSQVIAPAVALAKGYSKERAHALDLCRGRGPLAYAAMSDDLVRALGPRAGGTLSVADLEARAPEIGRAETHAMPEGRLAATAPWAHQGEEATVEDGNVVSRDGVRSDLQNAPDRQYALIAASDERGTAAAAWLVWTRSCAPVAEWGLAAPTLVEPVLRGVERARPGSPCRVASAFALLGTSESNWSGAVALRKEPSRGVSSLLPELSAATALGVWTNEALYGIQR